MSFFAPRATLSESFFSPTTFSEKNYKRENHRNPGFPRADAGKSLPLSYCLGLEVYGLPGMVLMMRRPQERRQRRGIPSPLR